ncbi:hypothetical protein [Actinophytocola sp.]|uniref:hypothetical protein n=1 Tax=Actinophytocola sp. TaxID=1872138 RepID=UPI002ED648FA
MGAAPSPLATRIADVTQIRATPSGDHPSDNRTDSRAKWLAILGTKLDIARAVDPGGFFGLGGICYAPA